MLYGVTVGIIFKVGGMTMKKKMLRCFGLLPAISLILAGCGNSTSTVRNNAGTEVFEETSEDNGNVSLKVWAAEEDAQLMEQVVSSFQSEYPDTKFDITVEAMSEADCRENLLNNVLEAPDFFTFADDQLASICASGIIKPIENADEISSRNSEGAVAAATVNDKLYAYPLTADNGYFMYYNKKYLSESDMATMDGILAKAQSAGKKVLMDFSSGWYLYSFYGNTGLKLGLNDDGISNYCTWNATDGDIKGTDVFNAVAKIGESPSFINATDEEFGKGAKDDTIIAGVSGVWMSTELQKAWGDNFGAIKLPTYTCAGKQIQMSSYAGYKMVGVNSYSTNSHWAAKFADWMTNEQNQKLRFEMRGQGPSNTNAANSDEVKGSETLSALISQSEYASLQRIGNAYWSAATELGTSMITGKTDGLEIQKYLDKIVEKITVSNAQ